MRWIYEISTSNFASCDFHMGRLSLYGTGVPVIGRAGLKLNDWIFEHILVAYLCEPGRAKENERERERERREREREL